MQEKKKEKHDVYSEEARAEIERLKQEIGVLKSNYEGGQRSDVLL